MKLGEPEPKLVATFPCKKNGSPKAFEVIFPVGIGSVAFERDCLSRANSQGTAFFGLDDLPKGAAQAKKNYAK